MNDTSERLMEREHALRGGWLHETAGFLTCPPCSRYGEPAGEQDERVLLAWAYAMGLLRDSGRFAAAAAMVVRLHDHKGELRVLCAQPLPHELRQALCRAWKEMGAEQPENVVFKLSGARYRTIRWPARRSTPFQPALLPTATAAVDDFLPDFSDLSLEDGDGTGV